MVSGSLPYLNEATIKDPLYRHIYKGQNHKYWNVWRRFRDPAKKTKRSDDEIARMLAENPSFIREFFGAALDILVSLVLKVVMVL